MSLQSLDATGRPLVGNAALAAFAGHKRRADIVEHIARTAALDKPVETDDDLGKMFEVSAGTIRADMTRLRSMGLVETDNRKFKLAGAANWTGERRLRARAKEGAPFSPWSAWPTAGKPAPRKASGLPPGFWSTRREKVSSAHTAPDQVEQAKDVVRRLTGRAVYHLATAAHPDKAFAPSRQEPGEESVVVGLVVMSERRVVALAAQLEQHRAVRQASLQ